MQRWQSQGGIVVGTGAYEDGSDRSVLLDQFSVASPTVVILGMLCLLLILTFDLECLCVCLVISVFFV